MPIVSAFETVFFLAAGFGTRLRPLTEHVPKALVPVGNEPQLFRLAARYPEAHLVVNAHHLGAALEAAVRQWERETGRPMFVSTEHDVLGTAGGIRAARSAFAPGPVLVHNADIEVPVATTRTLAIDEGSLAMLLVSADAPAGSGNVGLDAERRVVRLRAVKTGAPEVSSCNYLGVAVLAPQLLEVLPEVGCLVGDVWIPQLLAGATLRVSDPETSRIAGAGFHDLGTPRSYLDANLAWLHHEGLRVRAEAGARLHVECMDVLAAAGARLEAPCERVVVWPGGSCDRPLHDAIVTRDAILELGDQSGR